MKDTKPFARNKRKNHIINNYLWNKIYIYLNNDIFSLLWDRNLYVSVIAIFRFVISSFFVHLLVETCKILITGHLAYHVVILELIVPKHVPIFRFLLFFHLLFLFT